MPRLFTICLIFFIQFQQQLEAQILIQKNDTLPSVMVEVFNSKLLWKAAPVAVARLNKSDIQKYAPVSLVPVMNQVSGVRMEERSPGSYRLSIRGSLLRSPFGVRNLKLYWNQIPLSDATGNAYLNLLVLNDVDEISILKGPSASIYGAGTGGVILLNATNEFSSTKIDQANVDLSIGSYGMKQLSSGWLHKRKTYSGNFQQSHIIVNGYREHAALERKHLKYSATLALGKHQLSLLAFYTDLFYKTPGGITQLQMQTNPRLSRQATATLPSAIAQNASISNKTVFAGLSDDWQLSKQSTLKAFASLNNTVFENPFITNYERRNETNAALGLQWQWKLPNAKMEWTNGGEWLFNHSIIDNYGNRKGVIDTVQYKDNIHAHQWTIFSQLQWQPLLKWQIQAGISLNSQIVDFVRNTNNPILKTIKSTNPIIAPRLGTSYQISKQVNAYAIVSFGYSPPSLAEIRPSDGKFYGDLQPERGWNKEIGIKGFLCNDQLQFDLAYYHFYLKQAIVRRNNAAGAEYFVNAGSTLQQGLEGFVKYKFFKNNSVKKWGLIAWSNYAFQPYKFDNYQQGSNVYSGNALTGVARNTWVTGIECQWIKHYYLNLSMNAVDPIPLTDANDATAEAYQLVQVKTGYQFKTGKWKFHLYAGIDNLLNQAYSLGNDINAAGRRFYNPAAERNYFLGLNLQFH